MVEEERKLKTMRWSYKLPLRLRSLLRKRAVERELNDEVRFHLDKLIEEYAAKGLKPQEARFAALRELGGMEQIKEECRDMRRVNFVANLSQDIRYGVRMLAKSPGFTAVIILSLALGIGANTAIFSLIDAVMLKSLPVRQPEQLMLLNWVSKGQSYVISDYDGDSWEDSKGRDTGTSFAYPIYKAIRARNNSFSDVLGFADADQQLNLNVGGTSGLAKGQYVSGNYFSTLGVGAAAGRTIVDSDDQVNAGPVAVISYAYWTSRFGRDPSVVGKAIVVNSVPFTLVGVAAPEFFGLQAGHPTDAWIPLSTHMQVDPSWSRWLPKGETIFSVRTEWWVLMMARMKPGATKEQASAALDVIVQQETSTIKPPPPGERRHDMTLQLPTVELEPASGGLGELRRQFSQPLWVLMSLVGLVLVIACANVANLLLARSERRQKEIAVRLALGAGRRRIIRQLLTESLMLAAAGGACGVVLAYWGSGLLLRFMSGGGDQLHLSVSPDPTVLGFTVLVSLLTGTIFGLAPALRGTRLDLTPALKEGAGRIAGGTPGGGRMRPTLGKGLVIAQAAISLMLLVGAGLFVRTLRNLMTEDLGFDRTNLLLFGIDASRAGYKGERLASFYQEMQRRIEAIPGVRSATMSRHFLVNDGQGGEGVVIEGYAPKPGEANAGGVIGIYTHYVGSRFFETLGIPLLLGRTIQDSDTGAAPRIGVVNQAFARHYFGASSPIGHQFRFGSADPLDITIVGVAGDATYGDLRKDPPPTIYVPYDQHLGILAWQNVEVRTAGDPMGVANTLRHVIRDLDRNVPMHDLMTETEQIDQATFQERLFARLSAFFALLALTLACIGLYGTLSYAVARRTNEIGIRMAIGAERSGIVRMVLAEALLLAVLGVAIGIPAALGSLRLISSLLFGLNTTDPVTFVVAALLLLSIAALAGYLPARRAAKVDPMVALRYE